MAGARAHPRRLQALGAALDERDAPADADRDPDPDADRDPDPDADRDPDPDADRDPGVGLAGTLVVVVLAVLVVRRFA